MIWIIGFGVGIAVIDLVMTIVWHKPLLKPGPAAKLMYGVTDDDGVI
jgi:hypothetical protein